MNIFPGKKVKIKNLSYNDFTTIDEELEETDTELSPSFVRNMMQYTGKVVTIEEVSKTHPTWFEIIEDDNRFWWCTFYVDEIYNTELSDENFTI